MVPADLPESLAALLLFLLCSANLAFGCLVPFLTFCLCLGFSDPFPTHTYTPTPPPLPPSPHTALRTEHVASKNAESKECHENFLIDQTGLMHPFTFDTLIGTCYAWSSMLPPISLEFFPLARGSACRNECE